MRAVAGPTVYSVNGVEGIEIAVDFVSRFVLGLWNVLYGLDWTAVDGGEVGDKDIGTNRLLQSSARNPRQHAGW